jgi:hypothetical protein
VGSPKNSQRSARQINHPGKFQGFAQSLLPVLAGFLIF